MNKKKILAKWLGNVDVNEVYEDGDFYGLTIYGTPDGNYIIATLDEIIKNLPNYLKENIWVFNLDFLMDCIQEEKLREAVNCLISKCEEGNEALYWIIEKTCGIKKFVDRIISSGLLADIYSMYDGIENVVNVNGIDYYIYRVE